MTKDEALNMALEAMTYADACLKKQLTTKGKHQYAQALLLEAGTAIKEALAQPEPNYKKALEVWLDKTEWVQETVKPHELGMHRADVLKQRIEEALAQPEQHQDWCASSTQMLMSMPPKPAPCNCKPKPEPMAWTNKMSIDVPNQPLYTAPQRKPLSDEEILTYKHMIDWTAEWSYINFARAIEAAHGIKGEA